MGDYADMILEGETCQECGEYLGDACGYPRSCKACNKASGTGNKSVAAKAVKQECHICKKHFKGIEDHIRDAHKKVPSNKELMQKPSTKQQELERNSARYLWAVQDADNAEAVYAAVLNNWPDAQQIGQEIDAEIAKGKPCEPSK